MLIAATRLSAAIRMMTIVFKTLISKCDAKCQPTKVTRKRKGGGAHTYPLQHLPVTVTELVLEHSQEVGDDVETLREQTYSLVHLQVASHGLVNGFEVRLDPEQLGRVEDAAFEVDVDA